MPECRLFVEARDGPRVLSRVACLIGRLDLPINSFSLVPGERPGTCRMRFALVADGASSDLLRRLLGRLIEIESVEVEANPFERDARTAACEARGGACDAPQLFVQALAARAGVRTANERGMS